MSTHLQKVSNLKITFLVDNCIEWFTKLPPGFSHEIKTHLSQSPPIDKVTHTPILDFDTFCCGAHGFSALIETKIDSTSEPQLTLFDTGPDSLSLVRNLKSLQIPTSKISRVITSHWHSDHTGGLLSFLRYRKEEGEAAATVTVDTHPDRPYMRGIAPGPNYDKVIGALKPDPEFHAIEALGARVEKHADEHVVAGGTVYVSRDIPRVTPYEQGIPGAMRWMEAEGKWVAESHIMDERYAAVDVIGKGLVIFSACSHAGIVNVVKHAVDTFSRPIYMIIGGLHLAAADTVSRIPPTIEFLSQQLRPSPTYILPMHCSGFHAKVALEAAFGEGCVPAGVGLKIDVDGDSEHEARLFPAKY